MNPYNKTNVEEDLDPQIYRRYSGKTPVIEPGIQGKNIGRINMRGVMTLLKACYEMTPKGVPMIFGSAGIGKSEGVLQFAKAVAQREGREFRKLSDLKDKARLDVISDPSKYYLFLDLRAGELNPEQAQGIPDVTFGQREGYLRFLPPDWTSLITKDSFSGLIFLDELNRGQETVINSLFQFVLDRVAAGRKISDNALIVGAANLGTGGEFSGTTTLDSALINRFNVRVLVADVDSWAAWARRSGVSRYIIDFALSNPEMNFLGTGQDVADHNIPVTPRGLTAASRGLLWVENKYAEAAQKGTPLDPDLSGNIYNDIQEQIAGNMGTKWTNDFIEWLQIVHEFDWADILKRAGKKEFQQKSGKFDQSKAWALVNYITTEVIKRFDVARKTSNQKEIQTLINELYTILAGIDLDQVSLIVKSISANVRDNPPPGVTKEQAAKDFAVLLDGVLLLAHSKQDPLVKKIQGLAGEFKKLKENMSAKRMYEAITLRGHKATPEQLAKLEGTRWKHKLNGTTPSTTEIYKNNNFKSFFREEMTGTLSLADLADRVLDRVEDQFGIHYSDLGTGEVDVNAAKEYAYKIINQCNATRGDKQRVANAVNSARDVHDIALKLGMMAE